MRTFDAIDGSLSSASATLVSFPTGTSVSGVPGALACLMISLTAEAPSKFGSRMCGAISAKEPLAPR